MQQAFQPASLQNSETAMKKNPLTRLLECGQSFWMDTISREMIQNGFLRKLIKEDGLRGVTSNPDIFEKAISTSELYDNQIKKLASAGKSTEEIYEALAIEDIRKAADLLKPVYESSGGTDGFVSLEVNPYLAFDTAGTIDEAHRLWNALGRPNVFIKVPGTPPGIPAITRLIADGINVNVTLLFSLEDYERVMDAYLSGLEQRLEAGQPLETPVSVASFFLSRIDVLVDKLLGNRIVAHSPENMPHPQQLMGKAAVASAKLAYQSFKRTFQSERFEKLRAKGAHVQRPLWASTSTKNPLYPDTKYVEPLIGPETVNTMPLQTIDAWRDHGQVRANSIEEDVESSQSVLDDLKRMGIDIVHATWEIQEEGVTKFTQPFDKLLNAISSKRLALLGWKDAQTVNLGSYAKKVDTVASAMDEAQFVPRLWRKDASLWTEDAEVGKAIQNRLGWLDSPWEMLNNANEIVRFAAEIKKAGFKHVVLLGMGGSSLCPEVCARTFGSAKGYPELIVLDSTVPDAVRAVEKRIDLARTLFIPASKSGTTVETSSFCAYFSMQLHELGVKDPGSHFLAITDPGSPLVALAKEHGFRRIFENPPDIGGRYSALSYFGLVPMALIGIDVRKLLERTVSFGANRGSLVSVKANPSAYLGAVLGVLAKHGRDKLSFLLSPSIASLGYWIEQLVAESTGKQGVGILPVEGEKPGAAAVYGQDRLFVSIALRGDKVEENRLAAYEKSGAPVVRIVLNDLYDLGPEFLHWEVATAIAGALLQINPFDEPNVSESKQNTSQLLKEFVEKGQLPEPAFDLQKEGIAVSFTGAAKQALGPRVSRPQDALKALIGSAQEGDYVALLAYVPATGRVAQRLASLRNALRDSMHNAITLGYGPRYLHSTGQLHKGGANNGVFLVFVADAREDVSIPEQPYSFAILNRAQALGDFRSLESHKRRAAYIDLGKDAEANLKRVMGLLGIKNA